MSEEDRKLQKHLVDEMMKVSKTNPDVMFYMEALMKKYEELEQKVEQLEKDKSYANWYAVKKEKEVEQLENIIKEVIEYIQENYNELTDYWYIDKKEIVDDLLNILNKGSESNE